MRRPRSGRIGLVVRTVRISIFGQERDAYLPGYNVDCVATGAHWDGRCDRSAVDATGAGGSAGRAAARCTRRARPTAILSTAPRSRTRLRATHGYCIDRSAVADPFSSRKAKLEAFPP